MSEKETLENEIEAAVFKKLISHLQKHADVQNIDLMNLAFFCRNCLAKWYMSAAKQSGVDLTEDEARKKIYGMPFLDYKKLHQKPATEEQLKQYKISETKSTR